ncbi:hypothetical protein KF134_1799 [Lactococcus lactis subsp. lactis]|nr:hypothetical protein KF134_1799 [Lactococcus lactis subsp. lactis]
MQKLQIILFWAVFVFSYSSTFISDPYLSYIMSFFERGSKLTVNLIYQPINF